MHRILVPALFVGPAVLISPAATAGYGDPFTDFRPMAILCLAVLILLIKTRIR